MSDAAAAPPPASPPAKPHALTGLEIAAMRHARDDARLFAS